MGRIELSARVPAHLESLVTFVTLSRATRLLAIRFDDEVVLRPRVASRNVDSVRMTDLTAEVWSKLRDRIDDGLIVLDAAGFEWSEERATASD